MLAENGIDNCDFIKSQFLNDNNFKQNKLLSASFFMEKSLTEILSSFCNVNSNNDIIMDYRYFKILTQLKGIDKDYIIQYVINLIQDVLSKKETFTIHICLQTLSLTDLERYYNFIVTFSDHFKKTFSDRLDKCFFYKAPFIFSQLLSILSKVFDKKTMAKMHSVN